MSGILLVERSATLGHLLKRTLAAAQMQARTELSGYLEAVEHLRTAGTSGEPYALLLLGAPARTTREFAALLEHLREQASAKLPIIVMSHEKTPELADFIEHRAQTHLMFWADFSRIPGTVRRLLPGVAKVNGADPARARAAAVRILLVDDSQSIREAYRRMLERAGFSIATADSIQAAVASTEAEHFDLVIVDYFLPDGNGEELCRRLAARPAAPLLAIITGTYREEIIKRCIEAGASECLFKNEANELTLARVRTLARQITSQKSVEAERARLDGILGSVGDGVFGVDAQGVVTFMNPTGLRLLDYADESIVIGQSAHALFHHTLEDGRRVQPAESPLARAYAEGQALTAFEAVFFTRGGGSIPVECTLLPLSIQRRREGSVVVFRDISARKSVERLRFEATHDLLTGLFNQRHFQTLLADEVQRRREHGGLAALLYIDLDRFGQIETHLGAAEAERILVEAAGIFGKYLRHGDVLARLEGDRFGLLLAGVQLETLHSLADGFREVLHQCRYMKYGSRRELTASVGVALIGKDAQSTEQVLDQARRACRIAKRHGRDQTEIYVGQSDVRLARAIAADWAERLHQALDEDRFTLLVQPIVPLVALPDSEAAMVAHQGWRINGAAPKASREYLFEVLVRMVGADGHWISPQVFVPLAERAGLMAKIDMWVLQRLIAHTRGLDTSEPAIAFNLNLSNSTLGDAHSLALFEAAIRETGPLAHKLVFEITETSQLDSVQGARQFISEMKKLGCRFALDDFGTGFSSFTHLRHLPVDFVKIDGSFVEGMAASDLDRKMVGSITQLAQSLKLKVVGEHVDGFATLVALRQAGADYAQGHYLGEPRPLGEIDFAALFRHG